MLTHPEKHGTLTQGLSRCFLVRLLTSFQKRVAKHRGVHIWTAVDNYRARSSVLNKTGFAGPGEWWSKTAKNGTREHEEIFMQE